MVKFTSLFALASLFATGFAASTPKGCPVSTSLLSILGGAYLLESAIIDLPSLAPVGDKGDAVDTAAKSLHEVIKAAADSAKQSEQLSSDDTTVILANFEALEALVAEALANIRSKRPAFGTDNSAVENDLSTLYADHLDFSAALTALFPASFKAESDAVLAKFKIDWTQAIAVYKS
jgi:hypothetical protein